MFAPEFDPSDLQQMGWGLVMPFDLHHDIRDALEPLLKMREQQAGERFRLIEYRHGESASAFLSRHGLSAGAMDPSRLPYYLLIVGSPQQISFAFQQQLDVSRAVGRVHFDNVVQYQQYAASLVSAESSGTPQARDLVLFAPRHPGDPHSAALGELVSQLAQETLRDSDWRTMVLAGAEARKRALSDMLSRTPGPAIVLAAAHTIHAAGDGADRHVLEGAILCGEWAGIGTAPAPSDLFAAPDAPFEGVAHGIVPILWGSNTAGSNESPARAFVAALAQRLLGAGSGSALVVVGLAGRMMGLSLGLGDPSPRQALTLAIRAMTQGQRIGHAMQALSEAVAALSSELSDLLEQARFGRELDATRLVHLWSTTTDLRRVVTLGDPAVRLPAAIAGRPA